ncbi:carbamoyltransferase N-terminal domain-containing protein [Actinoplanes sp. L3-i22]|uniref:carbamoyltransferase N-terminal domain-containing protein n=1 Tax=Actinoplanes sp. L3-i22 TaxID=2836373 RepID=UPI001C742F9E|nr:carbamoyltransferase N-terminal domain-containing protein [Actinoplanes sp. L3-i22]BCY09068.1 carbamoyltransferase [Actinoplanes sp. L3-i22]
MIICGLKLTHDGGLAVLEDGRLVAVAELEKRDNNPRHAPLDRAETITEILAELGYGADDVDVFAVDGWHAGELTLSLGGTDVPIAVAPYHERTAAQRADQAYEFDGLPVGGRPRRYVSYHHATDHLFSAYCASPFAAAGQPALVLVWDGGMLPLLYEVRPGPVRVISHGPLLPVYGNAFAEFCGQFAEFADEFATEQRRWGRTRPSAVAGKAMAYAGLGTDVPELHGPIGALLDTVAPMAIDGGARVARRLLSERDRLAPGLSDADLIATFQDYLGACLVEAFKELVPGLPADAARNLCLAGGCALNIKWNSALRRSGLFEQVWVPPFPNDAGSALGAAMSHHARHAATPEVRWNVYSGAEATVGALPPGWTCAPCSPAGLGDLLAETGEPVIVMHGRAELGPRALGHRSILAPATDAAMKDRLNRMKGRESYRPVAPICLEERAAEVFTPGGTDPYMLFEHRLRPGWAARVPAVVHLDGTARLQTISATAEPVLTEVLRRYAASTGVPVLANTSANRPGRGFFPDVAAAAAWGGAEHIWHDGRLYRAPGAR